MNESNRIQTGVDEITDGTEQLLTATADMAQEKVVQARNRLTAALDAAKETCANIQRKTVETAKVADQKIRANPYQAIGIAFGVGAVVGILLSRRQRLPRE
jgi:ElaB/YqjD/DUF883 family membrane-anchored ribosome-binding protein